MTSNMRKKFVCFDGLVVGASSLAPEAEIITNFLSKFQEFLNETLKDSATFFDKMIEIIFDHH